ncbi:hypothetical protein GCM10011351_28330 [Paraliobacillus quinghaiensis]|uniref:Uncharacterized protein n=1 Tax=Paraliobacillus quinghaiensis TaxID=470815 RepID=A0A917TVT5_9BACI|nr:hypothetical protein [Paraliobacillus quinghaiensis]GGM40499.1 hypothetical protein GCM10011351_28330 [Paraliobacillus quinghaiensis]
MELKGWENKGRNLGGPLQKQFYKMISLLKDPAFVSGRNWAELKQDLASEIQTSTSQLGTILTVFKSLQLLPQDSLLRNSPIPREEDLTTDLGNLLYSLIAIEDEISKLPEGSTKDNINGNIQGMFQGFYAESMINFYYPQGGRENSPNPLHPARAILKALDKYGALDKYEFYLLCTFILEDDDQEKEELFEKYLLRYRNNLITFTNNDITQYEKGHQYLPQNLYKAGLVNLTTGRNWKISENNNMTKLRDTLLHDNFLESFYCHLN